MVISSRMASQKNPAKITSSVAFTLMYLACMKNSTTSEPFTVAIISASTMLNAPKSRYETAAVVTVRHISAAHTVKYTFALMIFSMPFSTCVMVPDQVQQRVEINPHQVHKVPVQSHVLHRIVIVRGKMPPLVHVQNGGHQPDPYQHVQRVEPGHHEIQHEEHLHVPRVNARKVERRPGEFVRQPVSVVLDSLQHQEGDGEADGNAQHN